MPSANEGMQSLIPVAKSVQDIFSKLEIDAHFGFPQIIVIGEQSAGKSSVLENFVGRDFLPRGSGIVTRRPLILQLIQDPNEYAEFLHKMGHNFVDFDEVCKEIEDETSRVTGQSKEVSPEPIHLRIFSPNVLNLTLIDLPGLIKEPVGDQPSDIEQQLLDMTLAFIRRETSLILAVTPANSDISTYVSLKLAKEVDPKGLRTIGVLTKLDLMDEGTDVREILDNKLFPLRLGYVGVVNRSQKDILEQKDIKAALEAEQKFFITHPSYRDIAFRLGASYLQYTANQHLTNNIHDALPTLRDSLQKKIFAIEKDVAEFKNLQPNDPARKAKTLFQMVTQFNADIERSIGGSKLVSTTELSGGTRIKQIFHKHFPVEIAKMEMNKNVLREEIMFAIRNIHGIRVGLFTPDKAFEAIARKQIVRMKEPSFKCVDLVVHELSVVIKQCANSMAMYPRLRDELESIVLSQIRECEIFLKQQIGLLIDYQLAYINTKHEDFIGFNNAVAKAKKDDLHKENVHSLAIRKGWLTVNKMSSVFGLKDCWFVLTSESLIGYKDEKEKDKKLTITLEGICLRFIEKSPSSPEKKFCLFYADGRKVYKGHKEIELGCYNFDEVWKGWTMAFHRAGVHHEDHSKASMFAEMEKADPQLKLQVETIRHLVDSYMRIVTKTVKDVVPKSVTHLLVNQMIEFTKNEILARFDEWDDIDSLLEESQEEIEKREKLMHMYDTCQDALRVISELDRSSLVAMRSPNLIVHTRPSGLITVACLAPALQPIRQAPAPPSAQAPMPQLEVSFEQEPAATSLLSEKVETLENGAPPKPPRSWFPTVTQ